MIRGTKSEEEIAELLKDKGVRTLEAYVDGLHAEKLEKLKKGKDNNYSIMDDWTIPATDAQGHSVRNQSAGFLVSDINIMPSTCAVDATTQKPAYDEKGHPMLDPMTVAAVKQELLLGHGVQVTFYEPDGDQFPSYLNKQSWSHYTWKAENHNHVVCIVGWDDDYAVGNFNQGTTTEEVKGRTVTYDMAPPGPGAWIVKNSWGRRGGIETKVGGPLGESTRQVLGDCDWGVDGEGFIYLSYYDQSIGNFATYGFMEDKASGSAISHQYDYLCVGFPHMSVGTSRMSAANVFEAEQDESITSVGMTTIEDVYNIRVDYDIYRLRKGATTPVDGELLDTVSCLYGYPGYHRERLDAPIALRKGERFSVVVTQSYVDAANGKTTYVISASYWDGEAQARRNGSAYYGKAVVNRGESWAYRDGIWRDWTDVLAVDPKVTKEGAVIDNFGIKAFAEPIEAGTYRWTTPDDPTWHRGSV